MCLSLCICSAPHSSKSTRNPSSNASLHNRHELSVLASSLKSSPNFVHLSAMDSLIAVLDHVYDVVIELTAQKLSQWTQKYCVIVFIESFFRCQPVLWFVRLRLHVPLRMKSICERRAVIGQIFIKDCSDWLVFVSAEKLNRTRYLWQKYSRNVISFNRTVENSQ